MYRANQPPRISPDRMHPYDREYLPAAQNLLGSMLDFVSNVFGMEDLNLFYKYAALTDYFKEIGNGNPEYIIKKTGPEAALEIFELVDLTEGEDYFEWDSLSTTSIAYKVGSSLAYYQWYVNKSYKKILDAVSLNTIYTIYDNLDSDDIKDFISALQYEIDMYYIETNLKRLRRKANLSQRLLSIKSGVALRQIQLFEQRQRDINKAQSQTIYSLSKVLCCRMEDLLELPKE